MEPDQLLVVDAGVVSDAAVEQPVGGEPATGGTVGGTEAGTVAGVVAGTTAGEAPVAGEVVAEGGTTAGAVGGEEVISAGTDAGTAAGVVAGETAGDVAQGGEQVEEETTCDESNPETCVCEPTEENTCEEQEVVAETQQTTKGEDDSCNQIGMTSPLMIAVIAAFTMKKFSRLFR